MKVLFATTNPAKINKFKVELENHGIEVLTLRDVDINVEVAEDGKNAIENAYQKAKAYYDASNIVTIGMDNTLFIEGVPEEMQPGTYVRRVNGKELTDDEMIEYYTSLVKSYGGKLTAKWVYGIAIYDGVEAKCHLWERDHFYFVDKPCETRTKGYPLDSITILPKFNKYLAELTDEEKSEKSEKERTDNVVEFIVNSLK